MTPITVAAAIWDADEPCSVKTASAPESSLTTSPRRRNRPLYFRNLGSNSTFFEVTYVHQCSRMDFHFVSSCFQNKLLFALHLVQMPCWPCFGLLPFLVHCCFRIPNFIARRTRLVHKVVMTHRFSPLPAKRSS